jgi:hypothetical protein
VVFRKAEEFVSSSTSARRRNLGRKKCSISRFLTAFKMTERDPGAVGKTDRFFKASF